MREAAAPSATGKLAFEEETLLGGSKIRGLCAKANTNFHNFRSTTFETLKRTSRPCFAKTFAQLAKQLIGKSLAPRLVCDSLVAEEESAAAAAAQRPSASVAKERHGHYFVTFAAAAAMSSS